MIGVIMAGGSGTRFWPLSRTHHPKQLQKITGESTLIQSTLKRITPLIPVESVYAVTGEPHAFETCLQLAQFGFNMNHLIAEPTVRNTAPALALITATLLDQPDELMAVFPADHVIQNPSALYEALRQAEAAANQDYLVTLGVTPRSPETGFGYIEKGSPIDDHNFEVLHFVEKPDLSNAEYFVQSGQYLWNCGIFVWKVSAFWKALEEHLPEVARSFANIRDNLIPHSDSYPFRKLDEVGRPVFENIEGISVDYAVMEKAERVAVVPCDMEWNDVGSWSALEEVMPKDEDGNVTRGDVVLLDSTGNIVHSDHRLVAAVGIDQMVVVDTPDALLLCPKERSQDIKELVEKLKEKNRDEIHTHPTVYKPWGSYTVLNKTPDYLIKRLDVLPGQKLSLQSHNHRMEHWVVAKGKAEVQVEDTTTLLEAHQSIVIPLGAKHRLSNPGDEVLSILETQVGDHIDEEDITRYQDLYGRTS